ncbi:hypothetical protein HI914_05024 [Erysiphe necator]|nr:hypothetical protein HI914_05024 [Erysiphe necator]
MVTMSMMELYQASPDFAKCRRKYSTRINEKRVKKGKIATSVAEEEEEILLAEATSSSAGMRNFSDPTQSRFEESYPMNCNSVTSNQFPQVNLISNVTLKTTARKDRAFRVPGEVLLSRDGRPGRIYLNNSIVCADQGSDLVLISPQLVRILRLEKNTLSSPQNQVITMGTADGASHRITEWVSFVFVSGGITRHVHAFVRPDKGMTNDLFLLLGLPWLHSVKAVINIVKSQIRIGDKRLGEKRTTLQGPTFEFTKHHRLLLEPTKTPFQGVLKTEPCDRDEICNDLVPLNCSNIPKPQFSSSNNVSGANDLSKSTTRDNSGDYSSSEDSITVDGSDNESTENHIGYKSASTDSDLSTEDDYSTDENSDNSMDAHSIN